MPTCFVIQPFDAGKFDKRFEDVYKPALAQAGLEAYRVDQDPKVEVPIEAIEDGIRDAVICLADITTDNPNVWYELGYAFATGRPIIMICCDERKGDRFPFDIQHRAIIKYSSESASDFTVLQESITAKASALLKKGAALRQIAEAEQVAPSEGLSQTELMVLAIIAGDTALPKSATSMYSLKLDAERTGLTSVGFGLAFRRLLKKDLVENLMITTNDDEAYDGAQLTDTGWAWIENNDSLFVLKKVDIEGDIPF